MSDTLSRSVFSDLTIGSKGCAMDPPWACSHPFSVPLCGLSS